MSLVLVKFKHWDSAADINFEGFKIMEKEEFKKHMRLAERQWDDITNADDVLRLYIDDLYADFEDFGEYEESYTTRDISNLQADMIHQGTGAKEFGIFAMAEVDD